VCTLVAWVSAIDGHPLVVAANRDENLGRASSPPSRHTGPGAYIAPVDLVAGGHWWALSDAGLFVGLTNRAGAMRGDDRRSRGLLVADLARVPSMDAADRLVQALDPRHYNGFHLLVTDGRRALRAICDGESMALAHLGPGMHVLTERGFGASSHSRDEHVIELFSRVRTASFEVLAEQLASHHDPAIDALCVHLPEADYGTRSSTLLLRSSDGRQRLWFAPGPPCTASYEELPVPHAPA
jgi:uncharacterized protein with NRDE domain